MNTIKQFIKEVFAEGKNITWPTRSQTIFYTAIVIFISLLIAYYLGLLDHIFNFSLNWAILRK